jgi:phage gpG-like protein
MPLRVDGVEALREHLEDLARRAHDMGPVLRREAEVVERMIDDAWAAERSPDGQRWPSRRGASRASGRLRSAHSVEVGHRSLTLRVPIGHASYQFFGTREVPGRNPLPIRRRGGQWAMADVWVRGQVERLKDYLTGGSGGR